MNCTENDPVKFVKITVKLETAFSDQYIAFIVWKDSKVATLASSLNGQFPMKKKKIKIPRKNLLE